MYFVNFISILNIFMSCNQDILGNTIIDFIDKIDIVSSDLT